MKHCARDTVLPNGGGRDGNRPIFVKKDTLIVYSPHVMHQRKDLWGADAHEFRPERWYGARHHWEFLPINGGPRICLGQKNAMIEAAYVKTRLLQTFHTLEPRGSGPMRGEFDFVNRVKARCIGCVCWVMSRGKS